MRKVLKIDMDGFYIEDIILQEGEETPSDCVDVQPPEGLFKLKWDGLAWIEGNTVEELIEIQVVMQKYQVAIQESIDAEIAREEQYQTIVVATTELVEQVANSTPETVANKLTLEEKSLLALGQNKTFLAITAPTNAQTLAQVKALTKQNNGIIRLLLKKLDGVD